MIDYFVHFYDVKPRAISLDIIHGKKNGNGIEIKVIISYETTLKYMGQSITCTTVNFYMNESI